MTISQFWCSIKRNGLMLSIREIEGRQHERPAQPSPSAARPRCPAHLRGDRRNRQLHYRCQGRVPHAVGRLDADQEAGGHSRSFGLLARRALGVADDRRRDAARLCPADAGDQSRGGLEIHHSRYFRRGAPRLAGRLWRARAASCAQAFRPVASLDRRRRDHRPERQFASPHGRPGARHHARHQLLQGQDGRGGGDVDRTDRLGRRQGRLRASQGAAAGVDLGRGLRLAGRRAGGARP